MATDQSFDLFLVLKDNHPLDVQVAVKLVRTRNFLVQAKNWSLRVCIPNQVPGDEAVSALTATPDLDHWENVFRVAWNPPCLELFFAAHCLCLVPFS